MPKVLSYWNQAILRTHLRTIRHPHFSRVVLRSFVNMRYLRSAPSLHILMSPILTHPSVDLPTKYGMIVFTGFQALGTPDLCPFPSIPASTPPLTHPRRFRPLKHAKRPLPHPQHGTLHHRRVHRPSLHKPKPKPLRLSVLRPRNSPNAHVPKRARDRSPARSWRSVHRHHSAGTTPLNRSI
jgi:hypothetical protein